MTLSMKPLDWLLLITLSFIWGGSFYYAEIALREVTPLVVVWGRVGGAALILLLLLRLMGLALPKNIKIWRAFFVMGFLNNVVPFTLIVWGQTEITGSLASIFNATTPLFTIILAQFLTHDEKIGRSKLIGILVGFFGVILMVGFDALDGISATLWAQIAVLFAAVSYGCAAIWGRRFKDINPMVTATGQVVSSSLVMTPIALIYGFPNGYFVPSGEVLFAIGFMAFFCTVVAYILYFRILTTSGATNLMLVTFLIPLSAILLGTLLLGERITLDQLLGMILILLALLIVDGRMLRNKYLKLKA